MKIGVVENVPPMAKGQRAYYRFKDPGDYRMKRVYSSPLQSGDFTFYRVNDEGQFVQIPMDGTLREYEASSDGYYYVVIHAQATFNENGQFRIDIENVLTVAFYAKFMDTEGDRIPTMKAQIETYYETHGNCDKVHFVVLGDDDTNVGALAGLITDYNKEYPFMDIDIILGCKADKDGALVGAGYAQVSSTSYSYGTDNGRRLWCKSGLETDANVLAMQDYLAANWAVA